LLNLNDVQKDFTSLHVAAYCGEKEELEILIVHGADIEAKNNYDWTPLHWAVARGHREVVELLIAQVLI